MTSPPLRRHAGLLIPLFSMPSSRAWGIGELADIEPVASWLHNAHQDLLQLLPINQMAVGFKSPYSAMSAMAIDPIFISVSAMEDFIAIGGESALAPAARALLAEARSSPVVRHDLARMLKAPALRAAFRWFCDEHWTRGTGRAAEFQAWCQEEQWWLDDYALFRALHAREAERPWSAWPDDLRARKPAALEAARSEMAQEILFRKYLQWVADRQWQAARKAAGPVALFGDFPFMVGTDSADVWARQEEFRLDASVGAPPDAFSRTGQNWGLPVYRWDVMAQGDFTWLRQRARRAAALYGGFRVDHLVGFYRTFAFPLGSEQGSFTPETEAEQLILGERVLAALKGAGACVIAEDLGTVPPFVRASLARSGIPGFRVLRWEREWDESGRPFRDPSGYAALSVAVSGTHDTETMAAWWRSLKEDERAKLAAIPSLARRLPPGLDLRAPDYPPGLRDALLETLFASGSQFLILPVQDVFGWQDRINVPATINDTNWTWRLPWHADMLEGQPEAQERAAVLREWSDRHCRGSGW
jgi:4-alpha-glucanotransferase